MEIFSTSSHCMTMTFKRTGRYTFKVTESREFDLLRRLGHDHTFANTGTFTVKHPWHPAKFKARWPSSTRTGGMPGCLCSMHVLE